jgi:hypothetical protein
MDSEADSSILASSINQNTTTKSKRGRSAHTTWIHTRTARNEEDSELKFCIHCTESSSYDTSVTTNMRKHLESKHEIIVDRISDSVQTETIQQLQQLYTRAQSSDQTEEIDTQVYRKHLNQDVINEALIILIVVRNLSFRVVE